MQVKPGYKQTEVGVVPKDWRARAVKEFASIKTGPFGTLLKASEYSKSDGVPLISVGEIREGYLRVTEQTPRVSETVTRRLPQYLLKCGDIVFGRKGGVERSSLIRQSQDGWFLGSDGISVRPTVECHGEYIALQFQSARICGWLLQNAIGTTMPSLNQEVLSKVIIPFPPTIAEQEAIAGALSDADAFIELLEQLLKKKREIKQGAMQGLLTGKTRLPGFRGEWRFVSASQIGQFKGGSGFPLHFQGLQSGEYPFYKVSDMNNEGNEIFMDSANSYISELTRKRLGATAFPPGTIVFAKVGAAVFLERKKILRYSSCLDNNMAGLIITDPSVDNRYVHYFLLRFQLGSLVSTTALPSLNGRILNAIKIPMPPSIYEQQAIASVLADIDVEIEQLNTKLTKARQIKHGMMQELLTGRIRLI